MFGFISFKTRILLGIGLMLAMMSAMAVFSYINDVKSEAALNNIDTTTLPHALLASDMVKDVVQVQQFLTDVSATRDPDAYEEAEAYAKSFTQGLDKFRQYAQNNAEELKKLAGLEQDFNRFYADGKRMAAAYISSGTEAGNQIMEEFDKSSINLTTRLESLREGEVKDATARVHELTEDTKATTRLLLSFALLSVFLGLAVAYYLTHYLKKQLGVDPVFAKGIAKEIAKGNFGREIVLEPGDTKSLLHALKNMQQQLRERMEHEQNMQQQLRDQMQQEAKAKESALRIKMALDKTSTNVMVTDENYNIIYLNESISKLFHEANNDFKRELPNFDADDLIGVNINIFQKSPAHQRKMLDDVTTAAKSSFVLAGRHIYVSASPVIDESGQQLGTVVEWQDRTHEVKIENEIKAIVEAVKSGKLDNRLETTGKSGFFQMLGTNINELTSVIDNVFTDITGVMHSLAAGDLSHRMTNNYDGVYGHCKTNINATIDALGIRIKREAEAKESALRIQMALDKTSTHVMMADENHNIIYMNDALADLFREAQHEMLRDIPHFDVDRLIGSSIDILHKNAGLQQTSLGNIGATFKSSFILGGRNIDFVANPVLTDSGRRTGTVVEWKDRTHEIKIENEIKAIVEAVKAGELHHRLDLSDKTGFSEILGNNINALTAVIESAFTDIATVMRSMAAGDLTRQITHNYEGVYGDCKNDINATLDKLRTVFSQIQDSAITINQYSDEISSGNDDLSRRAEQQAASLEETASSMEEMTGTVKHNADYAQQANAEAMQARTAAEQGSQVAQSAIQAMLEINESNTKIADIIGVIDEIALQTNILALNAAVEAARAGEQGRGFAVVASEVRNLAQRSAAAAKEIKILISDSVEKVEDGGRLVSEAGKSLSTIVNGVKSLNDIIANIAFESEQQFQGIKQINLAIAQMDDITQQNASLAEQTAAASTSMNDQSVHMRQLMAFFNLGSNPSQTINAQPRQPALSVPRPINSKPQKQPLLAASASSGWEEF